MSLDEVDRLFRNMAIAAVKAALRRA